MVSIEQIVSLAKRRGFVFPGSEIYGGLANTWDYGPLGARMLQNIKSLWWNRFVERRDDIFPVETGIIMNPKAWEASGHLANFTDPLVECRSCHKRFRADHVEGNKCPECGGELTDAKNFNLMFKTFIGPVEAQGSEVYLRPETAQGMFVNFKNILTTERPTLPFGIAQIGKAFRNEITPGNFIFRTLEFEQMEIEYFVHPERWEAVFEEWKDEMWKWLVSIGADESKLKWRAHEKEELSHYSKRTEDVEFEFPFGWGELYGLAYRGDFDLKNHSEKSGEELVYEDPETGEKITPHVVEPTFGVNRTFLMLLASAYTEDEGRVYLKLDPKVAPYKVAVFPLVANKPELVKKAEEIYFKLKLELPTVFDDRGNIGKRYYAQDEIGTPWCITVDYQTLEDNTVTIRDRDTMEQERINTNELKDELDKRLGVG
ncbi:glycine--tRNA ligase [Candidatus Microgenomates bacterium]|nr:glycine--tRNA ligase [Candidatus Microgenomates bacterium]